MQDLSFWNTQSPQRARLAKTIVTQAQSGKSDTQKNDKTRSNQFQIKSPDAGWNGTNRVTKHSWDNNQRQHHSMHMGWKWFTQETAQIKMVFMARLEVQAWTRWMLQLWTRSKTRWTHWDNIKYDIQPTCSKSKRDRAQAKRLQERRGSRVSKSKKNYRVMKKRWKSCWGGGGVIRGMTVNMLELPDYTLISNQPRIKCWL